MLNRFAPILLTTCFTINLPSYQSDALEIFLLFKLACSLAEAVILSPTDLLETLVKILSRIQLDTHDSHFLKA